MQSCVVLFCIAQKLLIHLRSHLIPKALDASADIKMIKQKSLEEAETPLPFLPSRPSLTSLLYIRYKISELT